MTPPPSATVEQAATATFSPMPDHLQLPETDGSIVENYQEHPQGNLLTSSLLPRLNEIHPDGQFSIGQDSGIYFKYTNPPLDGCRSPDWFYVPGVPPMLDGQFRRSYVLWQEGVRPKLIIEYASGNGAEERDATPSKGKFWIYENVIAAPYYAIFVCGVGTMELYKIENGQYVRVPLNAAGRLPVEPLGIELGVWHGLYRGMDMPWLRFWDAATGIMLPSEEERTEAERQRAEEEHQRAESERQRAETAEALTDDFRQLLCEEQERAEKMAARMRSLGIDPDAA